MRNFVNKNGKFWGFICMFALAASIAIVAACSEDDCKTCTNASNISKEYCGDELSTLMDSQAYKDGTTTCK